MSYGFEFFDSDGSLSLSNTDATLVLLDIFDISASSQGSRNYPGYSNSRVFAMAIRQEPTSLPGFTWDINNTWRVYPNIRYGFGHRISISGNSSQATVNWSHPTYRVFLGGTTGTATAVPTSTSTVYVYAI